MKLAVTALGWDEATFWATSFTGLRLALNAVAEQHDTGDGPMTADDYDDLLESLGQ